MTLTLFDAPPAQAHSPTSQAAGRAIAPDANRLRAIVYAAIREAGARGLSDEEGIDATGIQASTYRPRRIELIERGKVMASGQTRPTRSGRAATVWIIATEYQEQPCN